MGQTFAAAGRDAVTRGNSTLPEAPPAERLTVVTKGEPIPELGRRPTLGPLDLNGRGGSSSSKAARRTAHAHAVARLLRLPEQFLEIVLPNRGQGVRAVAAGLVAEGDHDGFAAFHADNLPFENAEFGGIDEIVGRIDGQQGALIFSRSGPGS